MNAIRKKNILLIVGGYSNTGAGPQFLEGMLRGHDKSNIHRFSLIPRSLPENKNLYDYSTTLKKVSFSMIPGLASINYWKFKKLELNESIKEIKIIIEKKQIDLVWVVLNGSFNIQIGEVLKGHIKIPYVVHLWDSPEYLVKNMRLDPFSKSDLMQSFRVAMTNATTGVSVSKSMSDLYKKKYDVSSKPMIFCPPLDTWKEVKKDKKPNEISVVFAGTLYAYKEWNAFLGAIEKFNASSNDKTIKVTCIGVSSRWAKKRDWVTYEKLKPANEAAEAVNKADLAYLPYWMDKSHALFVKTAFPSKMSFYVTSGTPVFFHGPQDSTPADFLTDHLVGKSCHSLKANDIIDTIKELLKEGFQNQYIKSREETLNAFFHPDRCVEIFRETINTALQPAKRNSHDDAY